VATDEGSSIATENRLWDAENGQVLLTRTYNEYDDPIENFSLPAHFGYSGMEGAYKNLGVEFNQPTITNGEFTLPTLPSGQTAKDYFEPGDEVVLKRTLGLKYDKAWVLEVATDKIFLIDAMGEPIANGSGSTYKSLRVIRSGKRNQTSAAILNLSSVVTPNNTSDIKSQLDAQSLTNALQVSSVAFSEDWGTYCDKQLEEICLISDDLMKILNCLWTEGQAVSNYGVDVGINPDYDCTLELETDILEQATELSDATINNLTSNTVTYYKYIISVTGSNLTDALDVLAANGVNVQKVEETKDANGNITSYDLTTRSNFDPDTEPDITDPLKTVFEQAFGSSSYNTTFTTEVVTTETYLSAENYPFPYFKFGANHSGAVSEIVIGVGAQGTWDDIDGGLDRQNIHPQQTACEFKLIPTSPATTFDPANITSFTNISLDAQGDIILEAAITGGGTQLFKVEGDCLDFKDCNTNLVCTPLSRSYEINPYLYGVRGNWRPKENYVYHTPRGNSITPTHGIDIREDGMLENFSLALNFNNAGVPFDVSTDNHWISPATITHYTPSGNEIENQDALGRYSSEIFGYDRRVVVAAANNAAHHTIGFDGFEEYAYPYYSDCQKRSHWAMSQMLNPNYGTAVELALTRARAKIPVSEWTPTISDQTAHSGQHSLILTNGDDFYTEDYVRQECTDVTQNSFQSYKLNDCNCIGHFEPDKETAYFISAWVKEDHTVQPNTYTDVQLKVTTLDGSDAPISVVNLSPSGPIIDGWQQIKGSFSIETNASKLKTEIVNSSTLDVYLDDVRIQPFNSQMKTYVYDHSTLRLMAELDENNFATFYEYDAEGRLLRIKKETVEGIMTIQESRYRIAQ